MLTKAFGRTAFGGDPAGYAAARPPYPDWVFQTLSDVCGLRPGAAVFEIGAGTGLATRRLLDFGAGPLIAIEPDPRLARWLGETEGRPGLEVRVSTFEDADLPARGFDLGVCATAFHWLDEDAALARIGQLLRPGGWWAAVWNSFGDPEASDAFHFATCDLLGAPHNPAAGSHGVPFASDAPARLDALARAGVFAPARRISRRRELVLDAEGVAALYATFSNVIARPDREGVLAELRRIADQRFGGRVVRPMITDLYIARRTRAAAPASGAPDA